MRFGAFEATEEGLRYSGTVLAWRDVRDVDVEGGAFVVYESQQRWASTKLDEVPNAFLLAEIVHAKREAMSRARLATPAPIEEDPGAVGPDEAKASEGQRGTRPAQ